MTARQLAAVEDALAARPDAERVGPASWTFRLGAGGAQSAAARIDGDWLRFDAACAPSPRPQWWLIARNAALASVAKLVVDPVTRQRRARVEHPLDPRSDPSQRVRICCEALARACGLRAAPDPVSTGAISGDELAALCDEAGWAVEPRQGGSPGVALDAGDELALASLEPSGTGVRLACVLAEAASIHGSSRRALGWLLGLAGAWLRGVRPSARPGGGTEGGLEICLEWASPLRPSSAELDAILASLSCGVRLCRAETRALVGNPDLARLYVQRAHAGAGTRRCTPQASRALGDSQWPSTPCS